MRVVSVFVLLCLIVLVAPASDLFHQRLSAQTKVVAPKKVLVPVNLAKGMPTTAVASQAGHPPEHAVDGKLDTRWCGPDGGRGYWWQVDLQKPTDLTGCHIDWESADGSYKYKVEGSADGKSWRMLSDQTKSAPDSHTWKFEAKAAAKLRHVRVTVTEQNPGAWASFFEFEVHGHEMVEKTISPSSSWERPADRRLTGVKVPAGWKATRFAAPPDVTYPTCLAAAPTGEVFVGVDENGSLDSKPDRGRIVRCIDTDHDGQADKFTTFAKIDSPRGLIVENRGGRADARKTTVFCLAPPNLVVLHDDNGDGVSDRQQMLVEGIGFDLKFRGADHTTNGIQMGIDGWVYVAVGDYGFIKATGTDKKVVQLRGGGIVRVRPDGSELEIVSRGQRNIYDVAISPSLDLFTRDNTNDGGGWNVRLSHVPFGAQMGYPTLFTNFGDEIVQPLADYGGGSPCGSLFVDEGVLSEPFGHSLFTCDWGRSVVYRHPLMSQGAGFQADQQTFVEVPRPTDMDIDGQGRFYISTWKDGGFNFSRPDVGDVVQVFDPSAEPTSFPDLNNATDEQLVEHIGSRSHVLRLHAQRELLRRHVESVPRPSGSGQGSPARPLPNGRGTADLLAHNLEQLAAAEKPLAARVAAIFTLKQLLGENSHAALYRLSANVEIREFTCRALADRVTQLSTTAREVGLNFAFCISDPNARVRLQAVVGSERLGSVGRSLLPPRIFDPDPLVAHTAMNAILRLPREDRLRVSEKLGDFLSPDKPQQVALACRVLQSIHESPVVSLLIDMLPRKNTEDWRHPILTALCRLYSQEADWDGKWWGTRPDTSGPYFKPIQWSESDRIAATLKTTLLKADPAEQRWLLNELRRHKVAMPEAAELTLQRAETDAALRPAALEVISAQPPNDKTLPLLRTIVDANETPLPQRAKALRLLLRVGNVEALSFAFRVHVDLTDEMKSNDIVTARDEFLRDARHAELLQEWTQLAVDPSRVAGGTVPSSSNPGQHRDAIEATSELAFAILLNLGQNSGVSKAVREQATKSVDAAWRNESSTIRLLRAVALARFDTYELQVRAHLTDKRDAVKKAAAFAADQLGLDKNPDPNRVLIGKLPFEQVVTDTTKTKGDANLGRKLFLKQGCVACHTISKDEPLKGPLLQDITKRYKREELIESILKPNAKIAQGFETQFFVTESGKAVDGFVVRESGDEIELRNAAGIVTVLAVKEIEERGKREVSMMPVELVSKLTTTELAAILAYLESLAK